MSTVDTIDHFVGSYGDLIFDLCSSLLSNPINVQIAFKSILKKIQSKSRFNKFKTYERSWVLRIACDNLLELSKYHGHLVSAEEQIQLDASDSLANRLSHFNSFFHRLQPQDQIILILKDKYAIPYSEIATAMAIPENSLKMRRQQALRALEEWLWVSQ